MSSTLAKPLVLSLVKRTGARCMSANAKVWVDKDTRVICQGFTGKQVRSNKWTYLIIQRLYL